MIPKAKMSYWAFSVHFTIHLMTVMINHSHSEDRVCLTYLINICFYTFFHECNNQILIMIKPASDI